MIKINEDDEKIRRTIAQQLMTLRFNAGYNDVNMIVQRFNVPYSTYMAWERGARVPKYEMLVAIADFYGVSCDFILGHTNKNSAFDSATPEQLIELKNYLEFLQYKSAKQEENRSK